MLRVALVGAGRVGASHIRLVRRLDVVEVVAMVTTRDVDPAQAPGVPVVKRDLGVFVI
jgi:predicted dehydrogenase